MVTTREVPASGELRVAAGAIMTPSAWDVAAERVVKIVEGAAAERTVALGADHGGFRLKETLKPILVELGFEVCDCGVAEVVAGGTAARELAAMCYDGNTARSSREHNDSNVVRLGGRLPTSNQAEEVLRTWLATPLGGGRHAARLRKITEIEKRYTK